MRFWRIFLAIGICVLVALASGGVASSTTQVRSQSDPTAWWWYYDQTATEVTDLISANGARIVDIEVEQSSPYRFSVAMVKNEGAYSKGWWWYFDITADQVVANLSTNDARLIDLEVYEVSGEALFAVVMVSNTGAQSKGWWWYYGVTTDEVAVNLTTNSARLVDIDTYFIGGQRFYSAVMISNTGADTTGWWWYINVTPAFITNELSTNNARLIDIERHDAAAGTYTVIMEACPCPFWWWYYDVSESQVNDLLAQNGARLVDVETYDVGGSRRFAVAMINNSNAITSRVGNLLRKGTEGVTGLYLKEVGGPVLAALQEQRIFEPASTIKVVHHLHAMQQVQNGSATLLQPVPIYENLAGTSCPGSATGGSETLTNALEEMMRRSDNERTKAIATIFGRANITSTAQAIGMVNTLVNVDHTVGCGSEAVANPNQLTLADAGVLYEGVADGTLLNSTNRETFYDLMAGREMHLDEGSDFTGIWKPALDQIISAEAPAEMTQSKQQDFKDLMRLNYKAGGYTLCSAGSCLEYRSVAGWAQIPYCDGKTLGSRQYVFGIFIHGATSATAADSTFGATKAELLREQIRAALAVWSQCGLPAALFGDIDGDSDITAVDALFVQRAVAGLQPLPSLDVADVNCDMVVDVLDGLTLLRFVAGLPLTRPDTCPSLG